MKDEELDDFKKRLSEFREHWKGVVEELEEMMPMNPEDTMDVSLEHDTVQVFSLKKDFLSEFKTLLEYVSTIDIDLASERFKKDCEKRLNELKAKYKVMFNALGATLPKTFELCVQDYDDLTMYVDWHDFNGIMNKIRDASEEEEKTSTKYN